MITNNILIVTLILFYAINCVSCVPTDDKNDRDQKQLTSDIKFKLELEELDSSETDKTDKDQNETPENIEKSLKELSELLKDEKSLNIPIDDDKFLIKFLRSMKYDVKKSFARIKKYYTFRQRYKEATNNLIPSSVKSVFENNIVEVMPNRDISGRRIFLVNVKNWDPTKISRIDLFRGIEVAVELVLLEPATQKNGVVAIVDFDDFSFKHLIEITPNFVGMALEWVQEIVPAKIGGVYVVNNPFLFTIVYNIIKPFMGQDLRSKFYVEGTNLNRILKTLGKEAVLKKHGGYLDNKLPLGNGTASVAEEFSKEFEKMAEYGYKTT